MLVSKGTIIHVRTRTKHDTFGECFYEIVEDGLQAPEKGRENERDGVKAVMLGGTGPSARQGMVVHDSASQIERDIAAGITTIVSSDKKAEIVRRFARDTSS